LRLKQQRVEERAATQVVKTTEKEAGARAKAAHTYEAALARAAKVAEAVAAKRSRAPRSAQRATQPVEGHQGDNEF
jgi:hypothetical protein